MTFGDLCYITGNKMDAILSEDFFVWNAFCMVRNQQLIKAMIVTLNTVNTSVWKFIVRCVFHS